MSINQRLSTITFELNGIPFVPSYYQVGIYVGPGNTLRTATELEMLGAERTEHFLWERRWAIGQHLQASAS